MSIRTAWIVRLGPYAARLAVGCTFGYSMGRDSDPVVRPFRDRPKCLYESLSFPFSRAGPFAAVLREIWRSAARCLCLQTNGQRVEHQPLCLVSDGQAVPRGTEKVLFPLRNDDPSEGALDRRFAGMGIDVDCAEGAFACSADDYGVYKPHTRPQIQGIAQGIALAEEFGA